MKDFLVFGNHDENTLIQMKSCASNEHAKSAVLCADGHVGYNMPIGGVVAYRDHISPAGVGFDIACGNKAVRLNLAFSDIENDVERIMDEVWNTISFGVGLRNKETVDHELFDDSAWKDIAYLNQASVRDKARNQLGTVGSGNHYVDLFRDENGQVWVGVHFGSRGFGHGIATHFLELAGAPSDGGMIAAPVLLSMQTQAGQDYWRSMLLAGRYAYAGRDWVCQRVASLLGAETVDEVHNHHNFAWQETHDGENLFVVRKGATPAFPGQRGFVGGSMGEPSVILEGVESERSEAALYSTVHGAGRVLSRTQAAGKLKRVDGQRRRVGGSITQEMMNDWVRSAGVTLRGAGCDESPHCYKRLDEVLDFHAETVKILHTLTPFGVAMAGENEFDPYKD